METTFFIPNESLKFHFFFTLYGHVRNKREHYDNISVGNLRVSLLLLLFRHLITQQVDSGPVSVVVIHVWFQFFSSS